MAKIAALVMCGAAFAVAGCIPRGATTGPGPASSPIAAIEYETGPCFGNCPVYKVRVTPDGRGVFTGLNATAAKGEHDFTVTPAEYAQFARMLEPLRPAPGSEKRYSHGTPGCTNAPTDMPSAQVRWTQRSGPASSLYYYFGCRGESATIADALGNAPDALSALETLIGARP